MPTDIAYWSLPSIVRLRFNGRVEVWLVQGNTMIPFMTLLPPISSIDCRFGIVYRKVDTSLSELRYLKCNEYIENNVCTRVTNRFSAHERVILVFSPQVAMQQGK